MTLLLLLAALMLAAGSTLAFACPDDPQKEKRPGPTVVTPVSPRTTEQDLRQLPRSPTWKPGDPVREVPDLRRSEPSKPSGVGEPVAPHVVADLGRLGSVTYRERSTSARRASTSGDRYVVHAAKGGFTVSDARGPLLGPLAFASLWQGAGPCSASADIPPAVHYDRAADRWLLARWAPPAPTSGFHFCIALSGTSDPVAGRWYVYDFPLPIYRADSEITVESDGYRLAVRMGGEQRALFVLDRKSMLLGKPAKFTRA